jgi:hypothetical protein
MFLDALKTLKDYEVTSGEPTLCEVAKYNSRVLFMGKNLNVKDKILQIEINEKKFGFFKINRNYKMMKSKILKSSKIIIYHNNQMDDIGLIDVVQIENENEILYSIKESRNSKLRNSFFLFFSSFLFFYFGYRNFKKFKIEGREESRLEKIKDSFQKII